jgi:putative transposase
MPRRPRIATGGYVYHALNRAVGRSTIFEKVDDYAAFEAVLEQAREQVDMRLLAFCVLPNQAVHVVSDSGRRALRACGTESTGAQP